MKVRTRLSPIPIRLGVNVDHVATIRQARGTVYPDPVEAGRDAMRAGADSITIHLREDRRHIQEHDVERMLRGRRTPVNLEMAVTAPMVRLARAARPPFCCLVPERRQELTTEGGLDVAGALPAVRAACRKLAREGIAVALFIDPDPRQLTAAGATGAPHLEIHTGTYADARGAAARKRELSRIIRFARLAHAAGFEVHAGHGLNLDNVGPIAAIPEIVELNIGHSIVARALSVGFGSAVREMRAAMDAAR
ncbi:MAG TPA: pyridoxine 5'-phosphate synthase [Verrucomicrobiae bacterium]|nr:pyridoxine 5'-phosphate synthase [Verrucomicrobiae bacterium]